MRPLLVLMIGVLSLGTVWTYARISIWLKPPPPQIVSVAAEGSYSLKIRFSFDQSELSDDNLLVRLNGKEVLKSAETNTAEKEVVIDDLPVRLGENRLFVSVQSVSFSEEQKQKNAEAFLLGQEEVKTPAMVCIRVQVFKDSLKVPGGDYTSHADGQSQIILDERFDVAQSEGNFNDKEGPSE